MVLKPINIRMDPNICFVENKDHFLLIIMNITNGELIDLTTHLGTSTFNLLSQSMKNFHQLHHNVVCRIL